MRVFRISKCQYIDDLSGTGAALFGGRWNSKGNYMLYTASTASLALLETIVHMSKIPAIDYCLAELELPSHSILEIEQEDLPANWSNYPAPSSLKRMGDRFLNDSGFLSLKIPSAVMKEEYLYLINPLHPLFKNIKILKTKKISLDSRLKN